jgi:hypothetical protein
MGRHGTALIDELCAASLGGKRTITKDTREIIYGILLGVFEQFGGGCGGERTDQGSLSMAQSSLPALTTTSVEVRGRVHLEVGFAELGKREMGNW